MKPLSQATWTRFGDQPVTFPVFKVPPRRDNDVFTLTLERVGQWVIVPVIEEEEKPFSHREVIGWACIVKGDDTWTRIYKCPAIFASKKKARTWAETYRLYPLDSMTPFLEDPQDYREAA